MTCLFIHGALYMINQISFTILKLNLSGPFQTLGMDACMDLSGMLAAIFFETKNANTH